MRKYTLYAFVVSICAALFFLTRNQNSEIITFYGFSENKEQDLNFDYDVKVVEIKVNSGQYVSAGDPLIKVERTSNPLRLSDLSSNIAILELKKSNEIRDLQGDVRLLNTKKVSKSTEFQNEILSLETKQRRNNLLRETIGGSAQDIDTSLKSNLIIAIEDLKRQKIYEGEIINKEISSLRNRIDAVSTEYDLKIEKLSDEKQFFINQEKEQILRAPTNGIVGFINCNPGENYSSFSKLVSLYDPHPQLVKAYILESMITSIEINDSVLVSSSLKPTEIYHGKITGFGTRITEIPNRLNKIPEFKMYGREVLITIPADNNLLQKEKVKVELKESVDNLSLTEKITNF